MARRESLTTPAGTISFLLPSDERVSELSQRWPFQLSAISDRDDRYNERAEFFLPFSDAAGVLAGIYLPQVPAATQVEAQAVIGFDRLVAARTLAALARSQIAGVVVCCVTCREQEGALVPGLGLFFVPDPADAAQPVPPETREIDEALRPGCGWLLDCSLAAIGAAQQAPQSGRQATPATGLKVASASYMGRRWLDFALVAGRLYCLQEAIEPDDPAWTELARAGVAEVVHMPVRGSTPQVPDLDAAPHLGPDSGEGSSTGSVSQNGVRRVYRVLCHLAACDGEVHPRERAVLEAFRQAFQIADAEGELLEGEGIGGDKLEVGGNPAERALLLDAMLDVAAADGKLAKAEEKRLIVFGELVGLRREALRKAILARFAEEEDRRGPTPRGLRRIYRLLWNLAACDGEIAHGELSLLEAFRIRHGISREEARRLGAEGRDGKRLEVGKDPAERAMLIGELVELAAADGELSPPERRRILKLSSLLNLDQREVEARLAERFPPAPRPEPTPQPSSAPQPARLLLLELPPGVVSLDLLQLPLGEGQRGFREVPPGVHRIALTPPEPESEGGEAAAWIQFAPGEVVVRALVGGQLLPVDPELEGHLRAQFASGELDTQLRPFPRHFPWSALVEPLQGRSFPPSLHPSRGGHRLSRFEHAWHETHARDAEALLAEFAWSFLRFLLDDDESALERYSHLVQALYHAGEDLPKSDPALFVRLVDLTIAQQRLLPRDLLARNSVLVFGSHYLSEDLVDTEVAELVEAGRRWAVFCAGHHEGAPPPPQLPEALLHPPKIDASHPFAESLAITAEAIAEIEAREGEHAAELIDVLASRGRLLEAAGDLVGSLTTQRRQVTLGERHKASPTNLAHGLKRLARLHRELGQGPEAERAEARARELLLQSYESN